MNLVTLPTADGESFVLNTETIVALVPDGAQTQVHVLSGERFAVALSPAVLLERMQQRGWRKGG